MLNDYGDYFKLKWPKYSSIKLYFWSNKTVHLNGLKVTSLKSVFVAEKTWLKYKTNLVKSFKHSLDQSPPHSLILLTACVIGTVRERERALDLQRVTHTGKEKKKGVVSFLCFFDCNLGHFLQKIFWNSLISRQNLFTRNNGESSALFRYRQLEVLRTRDHCILGKTFNTLSPHF